MEFPIFWFVPFASWPITGHHSSIFLAPSYWIFMITGKIPLSHLLCRLSSPSCMSLSSQEMHQSLSHPHGPSVGSVLLALRGLAIGHLEGDLPKKPTKTKTKSSSVCPNSGSWGTLAGCQRRRPSKCFIVIYTPLWLQRILTLIVILILEFDFAPREELDHGGKPVWTISHNSWILAALFLGKEHLPQLDQKKETNETSCCLHLINNRILMLTVNLRGKLYGKSKEVKCN